MALKKKMNQKIRIKKLLNKVRKKYRITGRVNIKIVKTETKGKYKRFIISKDSKNSDNLYIYPNNMNYRLEKIPDKLIEHALTQELIPCLIREAVHKKEKNPKNLRSILKAIDFMIDHEWTKCTKKRRKIKKKRLERFKTLDPSKEGIQSKKEVINMPQCPNCGAATSKLMVCPKCGSVTCVNCENTMYCNNCHNKKKPLSE